MIDKIIEILKEHEVFEVDIPDELSRNDALHDIAVRIDHTRPGGMSDDAWEVFYKLATGQLHDGTLAMVFSDFEPFFDYHKFKDPAPSKVKPREVSVGEIVDSLKSSVELSLEPDYKGVYIDNLDGAAQSIHSLIYGTKSEE